MSQQSNEMEKHYINAAILGPVSAGKSTLMNSLFVAQYSDMKIKRTTMTPQIYEEYTVGDAELTEDQQEFIKNLNHEINSKLVAKTENEGDNVTYEDISNEVVYKVPRVYNLHELPENVFLRIYDIPGLNDGKTADLYFRYLDEHFHNFDLIIFVVDINSACNTDGEVRILQKIVEYTKRNRELYGIYNKLIVLANKCDDLHIGDTNAVTIENEELVEMYDQIKKEVETQISKHNPELKYSICPLSAEDSYIYRMYAKNPTCSLDIKHVNKFGMNEYGKSRWNRLSEKERHEKIRTLMSELDIAKTLQQTGFDKFAHILRKQLKWKCQYDYICGHIMYNMRTLITQYTSAPTEPINFTPLQDLFKKILHVSQVYDSNNGLAPFYAAMGNIMNIHRPQLILRESDVTDLINEVDLEHYEWAQKHCQKWHNEFGEGFTTLGELANTITDMLNKYYESNINEMQKPVETLLKRLIKMFQNKFKITRKTLAALFTNNDMLNKKPDEILKIVLEMREKKIIEDTTQEVQVCKDILHRIYDNIYNGHQMEYIHDDHIASYVYLADLFWHETQQHNANGTVAYLAFRARQNMMAKINHGSRAFNCGEGSNASKLVLEKHLASLVG